MFDKISFVYFTGKMHLSFSIGNGQPREPALYQLYRRTVVPCQPGEVVREILCQSLLNLEISNSENDIQIDRLLTKLQTKISWLLFIIIVIIYSHKNKKHAGHRGCIVNYTNKCPDSKN